MAISASGLLRRWCLKALSDKASELLKRKQNGYVREGHGDLHLRNMLLLDGRVVPFDCLEFNSELRWIDVISDIAFLLMDLDYHGHHELSAAFLSGYLERTGDYGGLSLLPLYQVYRAMVRCKVACIRETQEREAAESTAEAEHEANRHLDLAHAYLHRSRPRLIITCGLSGSGKTTLAATVLAPLGAIRIRSDVERKRIAGIALKDACHGGEFNRGLYSPEMTRRTYRRLITLAAVVVENGWSVIVDAAFLNRSEREEFRTVAKRMGASFVILNCTAPRRVLVERIQKRAEKGEDPSDADSLVLKNQITYAELPAVDESEYVIEVDTTGEIDVGAVVNRIRSICDS
jgi:predicted kinase